MPSALKESLISAEPKHSWISMHAEELNGFGYLRRKIQRIHEVSMSTTNETYA